MKLVYVVDDDVNTRNIIQRFLEREGLQVIALSSGEELLREMQRRPADCIVLDIMMPGRDGLEVCRELRKKYHTPIIFLSAKGEELDRILGLELGADDYLVKPFSPRELAVRIKTILRRVGETMRANEETINCGPLTVDAAARAVRINGCEITLTNKEFDLLLVLARNKGMALSRDQLLDAVWGFDYVGDNRAVDDLVRRLRKKLAEVGVKEKLETVWGYGYRLIE